MSQHYPSWRYHRNGKAFLVQNPDLEPIGPDWAESPWPQRPAEPKLPDCCAALKAKFDKAWKGLQEQHALEIKEAGAQWQDKVNDCAALQAELEALKTEPEPAPKPTKEKKK